jgi:hypothetical protein
VDGFVFVRPLNAPPRSYHSQTTRHATTQAKRFKGYSQSPTTFFALPLMAAVAREASRTQLASAAGEGAAAALEWAPQLAPFPHPQLRSSNLVGFVLSPFIFAACMFGMVMQVRVCARVCGRACEVAAGTAQRPGTVRACAR